MEGPIANKDVLFNVLLSTDFEDLENLCKTNQQARRYCNDEYFWKTKFLHDKLPLFTSIENWKITYRQIYKILKDIETIIAVSRLEADRDAKIPTIDPNDGTIKLYFNQMSS